MFWEVIAYTSLVLAGVAIAALVVMVRAYDVLQREAER